MMVDGGSFAANAVDNLSLVVARAAVSTAEAARAEKHILSRGLCVLPAHVVNTSLYIR